MPTWLVYLILIVAGYAVMGIAVVNSRAKSRMIDRMWRDGIEHAEVVPGEANRILFVAMWIATWPRLFFISEPPVNSNRSDAPRRRKKPVRKDQRRR